MKPAYAFLLALLLAAPTYARDTLQNDLGMRFVHIPAGEFVMGTEDIAAALQEMPEPEPTGLVEETPAHTVVITKPFYLGETEVTQSQWLKVMENRPGPEALWKRDDWATLPVVSISWFMAKRFVEELNKSDTHNHYRLPTEAEWEYVAKDGRNALRPVPIEALGDYAWFINNSGDMPHPVATRKANRFGVYDMLGNVWEWVEDGYARDTYRKAKRVDPTGPVNAAAKVRRGGSYHCPLHLIRPGYRSANPPGTRYEVLGFRVVAQPR
ncbi:formylglycine-generating enzyme required for sulfatase activity [Thiogranum longum]|uniref:Formylglycine-generating enzyme required for sulfatase activity n=1 Tax=Thiogranum longum TaxID=1537524 RepID=A0A4R1HDE6_9GAMM|nr:formylglycine-generating enzyme family protein [Thiogranum longum]TCK18721.1 formylglycine-generating enzyme required for sulfatase activity [Thiogranum longum]